MKIIKIQLLCLLTSITLGTASLLHSAQGGPQFPSEKKSITEFLNYQRIKNPSLETSNITPSVIKDTFFSLVLSGDIRRIEIFFKDALDPDIFNEIGFTGLMMTTVHGSVDLLNLFLKAGAHVNLTRQHDNPEDQSTALDLALNHYTYLTSKNAPKIVLKIQEEKITALETHGAKTKEQLDTMRLEIGKRVQEAKQKKDPMIPVSEEEVTNLVTLLETLWGKKPNKK